jgi:hypothetical protein
MSIAWLSTGWSPPAFSCFSPENPVNLCADVVVFHATEARDNRLGEGELVFDGQFCQHDSPYSRKRGNLTKDRR